MNAAPSATFEAVVNWGATGVTLGVRVTDNAGATTVARTTAGITEYPAGSGIYSKTMTAPAAEGQYTIVWDNGTDFASENLLVQEITDLPTIGAALQAIRAKTDMLGTGIVLVDLPIMITDPVVLTIVRGDDYHADDGRAIGWNLEGVPDLTLADAVTFRVDDGDIEIECDVINSETVQVNLTAAKTGALTLRTSYRYELEATLGGGRVATLLRGTLETIVDLDETPSAAPAAAGLRRTVRTPVRPRGSAPTQ